MAVRRLGYGPSGRLILDHRALNARAQRYVSTSAAPLAGRKQTEPRDVFDLDLLITKFPGAIAKGDVEAERARKAANAAFEIEFETYRDLVVEFLEEDLVAIYDRPEVWEEMVTRTDSIKARANADGALP